MGTWTNFYTVNRMASFLRTALRTVGFGVPKINANQTSGMFVPGAYTPENKTRKNRRFDQIQSQIRGKTRGPSLIKCIVTTRNAYEALSRIRSGGDNKSTAARLAKQFQLTLNASIVMSDITDGYKRELTAYNDFLCYFFMGNPAEPAEPATERDAMKIIAVQSEILSKMSGQIAASIGTNDTPEVNAEVNELLARTEARMFPTVPRGTPGMPGGTRKHRSRTMRA